MSGQDVRRAAALPQALLAQVPAAQPASVQPAVHADAAAASVHQAVQSAATGGNTGGPASQDAGTDAQPVQAGTTQAAAPVMGAVAAAPAQPVADTVKLAGPPTAWRQSLQETLGDKLHVQVTNNVQQATISIEPPQLGRIDIAIRHSAGTLEVNISATNGEVLRQLQTVGDNLRNDLSQRQYTEVAVTVTPTPKNGAAPFGDPQQQQGRGRQQGREQDNEPGRGLAEAGNPASVFKLGRDS
jgi:flagellar hook-length control protein FliK